MRICTYSPTLVTFQGRREEGPQTHNQLLSLRVAQVIVDAYACERLLVAAKASLSRELTLTNERLAKLEKRMAVANEEAAASIAMAEKATACCRRKTTSTSCARSWKSFSP